MTPTTTRATTPSEYRRPMSKKWTRTVYGFAVLGKETPIVNLKFRKEPWCGPAATREFLIWATCPTGLKNHFTVSKAVPPRKGTKCRIYKLVDYNDKDVKGSWYPQKLQKISDNQYRNKKVLRKRTLPNGTKEIFVRWEGWPEKYNSWRTETDKYDVVAE